MEAESQRPNEREGATSTLNAAIETLNPVKTSCFPPAMAIFGSVILLLALIRVCFLLSSDDLLQVHT